ncbi:hypothetical protein GGF43_004825 [Coemansia sp. RSA 2618]|nr:hypothetical protein GGF43_004825 [Coemansia sp. RSA 2618]
MRSLASQHPLLFAMQPLSSQLTRLDIPLCHKAHHYIPQLHASSLKFLRLHSVPHGYSWRCFADSAGGCIDFGSLETLDIRYLHCRAQPNNDEDVNKVCCMPNSRRIRFFKLQHLYISDCPEHCCFLECSVFLAPLKIAKIRGSAHAVRTLSRMQMPAVDVLKLAVTGMGDISGPQLMLHTRHVLKAASSVRKTEFRGVGNHVHFDPQSLEFPTLTSISIHAPTDAARLMLIISKAPCLEYLALGNLVPENIPEKASRVRSGWFIYEYLEPFDTQLRHMYLKHADDYYTVRKARSLVQFLVLLVPSLQTLATMVDTIQEISGVLKDYTPFYPHLQNIEYCNARMHVPKRSLI